MTSTFSEKSTPLWPYRMYDIVYADPPWEEAGGGPKWRGQSKGHYPLMKMADIINLPVEGIANENAVLFLWCPFRHLKQAFDVVEHWGFNYVTIGFLWVKMTSGGKVFFGMGRYTRANPEPCLLATKGKGIAPAVHDVAATVMDQVREHSRKPDKVREQIERMYPSQGKIELFARQQSPGWDCWGIETNKFTV
jgi:N6-adenosine-specific RNA methylase IME4